MGEVAQRCAARRERIAEDAVLFGCADRSRVEELCADLEIEAHLGIAANRFVAEVASYTNATVAVGQEASFLAPLSVELLPIEDGRKLRLLGLTTLGQVAALTQEELYSILGDEGFLAWELARGIDERPLAPTEETHLPEVEADLEEGIEPALQRLFAQLRGVCHELQVCGGKTLSIRFSRGTRDWRCAARHLRERLQFDEEPRTLRLLITEVGMSEEKQLNLFHRRRDLSPLMRRPRHLMRIVWDDPDAYLPERRAHLESWQGRGRSWPLCPPRPTQWSGQGKVLDRWQVDEDWWTPNPVRRAYFRMRLPTGAERRFFRDRVSGEWFRQ